MKNHLLMLCLATSALNKHGKDFVPRRILSLLQIFLAAFLDHTIGQTTEKQHLKGPLKYNKTQHQIYT